MIQNLFKHMQWADAEVWRAVLDTPSAKDDPKTRELLYHIHLCQRAYLLIWTGQPLDMPEESAFNDLMAIANWGRAYYRELAAYITNLAASALDKPVDVPWLRQVEEILGKAPDAATASETMVQVTSHTTHHRGQLQARLRQLETDPPMVDFIAWVWLGKPEAEWPNTIDSNKGRSS
jgi:uncharacterized damage-inducible protein DinB